MTADRILLFVRALEDLPENRIAFGFDYALKNCGRWLPSPGEIRGWAEEWNPLTDRQAQLTAEILHRSAKPDDWKPHPIDSIYAEIDRHRAAQRLEDLAYVETLTDADWPDLSGGKGQGRYVDYVRRKEARAGVPLVPAARHSGLVQAYSRAFREGSREPGAGSEEDQ